MTNVVVNNLNNNFLYIYNNFTRKLYANVAWTLLQLFANSTLTVCELYTNFTRTVLKLYAIYTNFDQTLRHNFKYKIHANFTATQFMRSPPCAYNEYYMKYWLKETAAQQLSLLHVHSTFALIVDHSSFMWFFLRNVSKACLFIALLTHW